MKSISRTVALQVWFSVQSDFGITLGELGKLASNTDSKLIASTLQALKDIVSVEASAGESQFMTGAVETSSFGTFAISSNKESKLVMSYIISVSNNETVPEELETTIQRVCTNFGKQLTQLNNIGELAQMGAMLPMGYLSQAFMNAITIVQLETKIKRNEKQLEQDIDRAIESVLDQKDILEQTVEEILDDKFIQSKDHWFSGYPSKIARLKFLEELSKKILLRATLDSPLMLINSENPRIEHNRVMKKVLEKFNKSSNDFDKRIIEVFKTFKEKEFEKFISSISLFDLHMVEEFTYNEFLKRAILEVSKTKPSVFYSKFDRAKIRAGVISHMPALKVPNFGEIMTEIVTKFAPAHTWNLVKTFYDTLITEMIGKKFTVSAVDMSLLFAQYFIEPSQLKKEISKDKTLKKQWKDELLNLTPDEKITNLEVDNIEEAVLLSNAAGNTVVNVFVKILNQYFIGGLEHQGEFIDRLAQFYNETAPKIKTSTILISLLEVLDLINEDINFVTPSIIDIIGSFLMTNNSEFIIDETKYQVAKKLFGSYVVESKNDTADFIKFLEKLDNFELKYDERTIKIELGKFNISDFPQLVIDESNIIQGIELGMQRKLENKLKGSILNFSNQITEQLQAFAEDSKSNKFTAKELGTLKIDIPKFNFDAINYGEFIHGLNLEVIQQIRSYIDNDFQVLLKEIRSKVDSGSQLSKSEKSIRKFMQNYDKFIESTLEEYGKSVLDRISDVMKGVKSHSKKIRKNLDITNDDIFFYDMTRPKLVSTPSEIEPRILDFIQNNTDIDFDSFNEETLRSNLSVKLFDSISNSTLERSFDQIIQNSMDKRIKKLRNESKNVAEFESNLRDQGRVQAYDLFEDLTTIVDKCTELYIKKDGVVTIDANFLKLHLGRLPISKYNRKELITDLIKSPNLRVERDGNSWLISYGFTKVMKSDTGIPSVITFKDTAHYVHKLELMAELNDILLAIQDVGRLIETETYNRIAEMKKEMFNVIYADQ